VLPLARVNSEGKVRPAGGDSISGALHNYAPYRTRDGRVLAVAALEPKFWEKFCDVIGRPDLKACDRSATPAQSAAARAQVAAIVASLTLAQWQQKLEGADCCVSPVLKLEESLQHPHFRARGMVHETRHPQLGALTHVGFPVRMTGFAFAIARQAPAPGEHSAEVLGEIGYSQADIAALQEAGAI
jgi:alpha-methylacyl-CoA racemase